MGRLIDCNDVYNAIQITTDNFGCAKKVVEDNMLTMLSEIETVEAIPKAEYKARLKADLVAILDEFDLQFDEICFYKNMGEWKTVPEIKGEYKAIIREKINALKGANNE